MLKITLAVALSAKVENKNPRQGNKRIQVKDEDKKRPAQRSYKMAKSQKRLNSKSRSELKK